MSGLLRNIVADWGLCLVRFYVWLDFSLFGLVSRNKDFELDLI